MIINYRAYIAASRRFDRGLEARLESARRASEIHKERTGKPLRVTEDDVLNIHVRYVEVDESLSPEQTPKYSPYSTSNSPRNRRPYVTTEKPIDYTMITLDEVTTDDTTSGPSPAQDWTNPVGAIPYYWLYPEFPITFHDNSRTCTTVLEHRTPSH